MKIQLKPSPRGQGVEVLASDEKTGDSLMYFTIPRQLFCEVMKKMEVCLSGRIKALDEKSSPRRHYAIFAFSGGYKVVFGTPYITGGEVDGDFNILADLEQHPTIEAAIQDALKNGQEFGKE